VQDVYSLRCAPAVHGGARDSVAYARKVAEAEINAATDNPLFFSVDDPWDYQFRANWPEGYRGDQRISYSAGNFHGEPVGLAADFLAIGLAELANISERRTQMLLDAHHNRNLPSNLIPRRGVNSGLMIAQYCAAGIVSENKVLAHPSSVDSIPTSANSEDHNAMSTYACRKLRTVLRNVQAVLAIELLVAAQAIEWRVAMEIDPCPKTGRKRAAGEVDDEIEGGRPIAESERAWQKAEQESKDFATCTAPERRPVIAGWLGGGTRKAYLAVREVAGTMLVDRMLDEDIRRVRGLIEGGAFSRSVS
jgi:histidine ammonia-lyase